MENERVEREQSQFQEDEFIDSRKPPPWRKQITVRAIVASLLIGIVYSVICLKLNLTTGLVPNLNISSALLAFVFLKSWTKVLQKAGIATTPFTRQENTIAQTCAVACYSISLAGGFASYLLGLNRRTYEETGVNTEGNNPRGIKEPGVGWMTSFLFVTSFIGLVVLVPLRKVLISSNYENRVNFWFQWCD